MNNDNSNAESVPSEQFIQISNLYRYYGSLCAVDDISFSVAKGEILGLLGPNGAGKSTIMQMLTGVLAPSSGEIVIKAVDLLAQPLQAKTYLGYLPEIPPLYPELLVDDFLRFCGKIHRVANRNLDTALEQCKQRCGLSDVGHRLIGNLSKGYQQRVGIAQAIIHKPDIVVLDEPTVGLDPIQIREIRKLIKELGGEHSVILSSHILPEIQTVCDRAIIINNGKLVFNDTVTHLQQHMSVNVLTLGLKQAPPIQELEKIAGLLKVEAVAENLFQVHFDPNNDPAQMLAKHCVEKGWGLFQLSPVQQSLEEIFVNITTSDTDAGITVDSA